jgi:isoleucyl-tRNA synthetase
MAFFLHKETGALHPDTPALLEAVAKLVEQRGIEAWQAVEPADLLGPEADQYEKNRDTLDVWFDSGTTHATVLGGLNNAQHGSHGELPWPADMYLEGSDQHRGWFHSSLLTGCMLEGRAPYNSLLTHGFVVDGQGRKMSKSVGNVIAPQKVSDSLGAEILRLWVASTDYSGELSISDEILKRVVESYRRIRNTLRFLLANLADFDAATDAVSPESMLEIDRYALAMTAQMQAEVLKSFEQYEFQPAMSRLQHFCSEDLGSFYLDVLKDRLYTSAPKSQARRSAQTALLHITQTLLKLMAPILSFTAEEAWGILCTSTLANQPDTSRLTIFTECYHSVPTIAEADTLQQRWSRLREIRGLVTRKLEELRTAGSIGSSLQGEVDLTAQGTDLALLQSVAEQLPFILIVSRVGVHASTAPDQTELAISIAPSQHKKCERCWHWREDIGHDAEHPDICGRCVSNLHEAHANG